MKKITLLLCLGLLGCATVAKESQTPPRTVQAPVKPMVNEIEMDSVISVFSEAINKDPNYAGAYYNRAIAYFYKKDYEKCWKDIYVAESLGYKFSDDFMGALKKASRREK
ncbi:MAG TPA: tetratricopeptide repeat protein [Candidatus Omnitrophota bacterium]|nr:tetratricopeptide repeat protein [Candidatus Omnitrophota bacterium]HPT39737.1 tetratricopeptide repeat protein [Candidatus Omnitrophota bacterium]